MAMKNVCGILCYATKIGFRLQWMKENMGSKVEVQSVKFSSLLVSKM